MAEDLTVLPDAGKEEHYLNLLPQVKNLLQGETDIVANLANMAAAIAETFSYFWVGFYIVKGGELVLGPFQGPVACTRIKKGKGVCGAAWEQKKTLVVPNVDEFPGHIACSSKSKSEIVVPILRNGEVLAVLDVDSEQLSTFDEVDSKYLNKLVDLLQF